MKILSAFERWLTSVLSIGALALGLEAPASAQTIKIDDGTPGPALSYAYPEDLCWINRLHVDTPTTLTSIEAILGDAPNGTPVKLCIWRDLAGYGQPWDGLLVASINTTVRNSGTQMLTEYAIPPTVVNGNFFVGAVMTVDGSFSPASFDPHTPTLGRAWMSFGYGPGTYDPSYLGMWTWYALPTIGFQGVFMMRANGANGPTAEVRCLGKTNSLGCAPLTGFSGTPSATSSSGFVVTASNVYNQKSGLLLYGLNGGQQAPFGGGHLCVRPPLHRTGVQSSAGSVGGNDCSGTYTFDFNAWIASGADPALSLGTTVDAQFWSRDPGFSGASAIGLSRAVHFGIWP